MGAFAKKGSMQFVDLDVYNCVWIILCDGYIIFSKTFNFDYIDFHQIVGT